MKKMLTKMLAVAMAWAMLLSCTVMASAATADAVPPRSGIGGEGVLSDGTTASHNYYGGWGAKADLQVTSTGTRNYASGEAKGTSHNEGRVPSDVIRLMMPTVGKNALDMILDPHELITQTSAARYGSAGRSVFTPGKQVYFLTKVNSGGKNYYTDESQTLTITNKSSVPVSVNLTLRVNKGSGSDGDKFTFVNSTGDLKAASKSAGMYLALVSGTDVVPVKETKSSGMHSWETETVNFLGLVRSGGLLGYISSTGANSGGVFQWLTSDAKLRNELYAEGGITSSVNVEFEVIVASGGDSSDVDWAAAYPNGYGIAADSAGHIIKMVANVPTGYIAEIQPDYLTAYTAVKSAGFILNTSRETPVSVLIYSTGKVPVGAMYFNVAGDKMLYKYNAGDKATISVASNGELPVAGIATLKKSIAAAENAYVTAYSSSAGYYLAFREEDKVAFAKFGGTGSADYDKLDFNLKAAIGGYEEHWDVIGGDIGLDLIWDVYAAKKLSGTKPVFEVTTKAISKKAVVLKVTEGTDDYAGFEPKLDKNTTNKSTVSLSNGKSIQMTVAKTNATATAPAYWTLTGVANTDFGSIDNAATVATVVLSKTGESDINLKVSGLK